MQRHLYTGTKTSFQHRKVALGHRGVEASFSVAKLLGGCITREVCTRLVTGQFCCPNKYCKNVCKRVFIFPSQQIPIVHNLSMYSCLFSVFYLYLRDAFPAL